MKICVFDTETIDLEKCFVYNIGFCLFDTETAEIMLKEEYVIEQVWHNTALFETAYYANKKDYYSQCMRGRTIRLEKFGYVTQRMYRLFKEHEVTQAYAFNSPFDERVFAFNCEWFKCINPFDNIAVHDIRAYAVEYIGKTEEYKKACDENQWYTEKGNYGTTAEIFYRYIMNDKDFIESHTALDDSIIETAILLECIKRGAEYGQNYEVPKSLARTRTQMLEVYHNGEIVYERECNSIYKRQIKDTTKIYLKGE